MSERDTHATPVDQRLLTLERRNWVKCTLGLEEMGNALRPHVEKAFRDYYEQNVGYRPLRLHDNTFNHTCHRNKSARLRCKSACHRHSHINCWCFSCLGARHNTTIENYDNWCHHFRRKKGKWYFYTEPHCETCEYGIETLQALFIDPDSDKIYWTNVEFPKVFGNPWQLAKVFMPKGNQSTDSLEQADVVALLTVMNTCNLFHVNHAAIDKLCEQRNNVMHSSSHEMNVDGTDAFFEQMVQCLEGLKARYPCDSNIAKLKQIKNSDVTADMFDKVIANSIQEILHEITDQLAAGHNADHLIERLKASIKVQHEQAIAKEYKEEIDQLKKELEIEKSKGAELEKTVEMKDEAIQIRDFEIGRLKGELEDLQKTRNEDMERHRNEILELNQKIADLEKDRDSKEKILIQLRREVDDLVCETDDLKRQLNEKETDVRTLTSQVDSLERANKSLEDSIHARDEIVRRLTTENQGKDEENQRLSDYLIVISIVAVIVTVVLLRIGMLVY